MCAYCDHAGDIAGLHRFGQLPVVRKVSNGSISFRLAAANELGSAQGAEFAKFWAAFQQRTFAPCAAKVWFEPTLLFRQNAANGGFATNSRGLTPRVCRNI